MLFGLLLVFIMIIIAVTAFFAVKVLSQSLTTPGAVTDLLANYQLGN